MCDDTEQFFALSLALSISTGEPFLKWQTSMTGGVLYVDGEMALAELRTRLISLQPDLPSILFLLSGETVFKLHERDLNLTETNAQTEISSIISKHQEIKVLIIDNISCLFRGLNEDSKNDWEMIIPFLLLMRRRSIAVVLVHHAGKSGDQRGTSGREDLLDCVIKLEEPKGRQEDGANFIVKFTKSRSAYGDDIKSIHAALRLGDGQPWSWKPYESSALDQVIGLVRSGLTHPTEIAEELSVTKGFISQLKRKGIEQGIFADKRQFSLLVHEDP